MPVPFEIMSWVLPSPSLGDGLSTGPMTLWIENSEMAAVVVVVFFFTMEQIWRGLQVKTESGINISR